MRLTTNLVTVIFFLLLTPVLAKADGPHSVSSAVQFDVSYRCVARGAAEPPPDKAHLWIYPVNADLEWTPRIRLFASSASNIDYGDLTVFVSIRDVLFGTWLFENDRRIHGGGGAEELYKESGLGSATVDKITDVRPYVRRARYDCSLYRDSPNPDPEPPPSQHPCTPTTDALDFGGYRVRMCYVEPDGEVGQARAGVWASSESGILWFFSRENAEVLVKVLDGCRHNGYRWVFVAPVTTLAFRLRVEAPDGETWTHTNEAGTTAPTKSDTSAFRCR